MGWDGTLRSHSLALQLLIGALSSARAFAFHNIVQAVVVKLLSLSFIYYPPPN